MTANLAEEMWAQCLAEEQSVRVVREEAEADRIRAQVRRLARAAGVGVRTARMGQTVVVVRLDAQVWREDTATMRRKLSPPESPSRH